MINGRNRIIRIVTVAWSRERCMLNIMIIVFIGPDITLGYVAWLCDRWLGGVRILLGGRLILVWRK